MLTPKSSTVYTVGFLQVDIVGNYEINFDSKCLHDHTEASSDFF